MEYAECQSWWESILGALLFVFVMLPVVLVMRLFGWRQKED